MKRFIIHCSVFGCIVATTLALLAAFCLLFQDKTEQDSALGVELNRKISYLKSLPSPKCIIVGGSGCSHGINSIMLGKELNLPIANTGIHAALGLAYQLQVVSPYVFDEDIVLVIPEYPNFTHCLGDATALTAACDIRPEDRKLLDSDQWLWLSQYMPKLGIRKIGPSFFDTIST